MIYRTIRHLIFNLLFVSLLLSVMQVTAIEEVNYPAMIRSSHVAPPGLGRFFESFPADFLDVRFGDKLKDVGLKVCDDIQFTNKCYELLGDPKVVCECGLHILIVR